MSIEVGDAVLKFLGDSTQLDAKFAQVGPNAEKAFEPAAEAAEEAGQRMTSSMYEARGEVALLGEEVGVHLPRHVQGFIASIPGVGQALSTAFSATAILFVAQALVQASDKLSKFLGDTLIFTDAMRESNQAIADENKALESLSKQRADAIAKLEELKGVTKDQEQAEIDLTHATVAQAKAELESLKIQIASKSGWQKTKDTAKDFTNVLLSNLIPGYSALDTATEDYLRVKEKEQALTTITAQAAKAEAAEKAAQAEAARQNNIKTLLEELENQKKIALAYTQTDEEKNEIELNFGERRLALLKQLGTNEKSQVEAQLTEIEVLQIQHAQRISAAFVQLLETVQQQKQAALDAVKDSVVADTIAFTPLQQAMMKGQDAAHLMGVTLRSDLVDALQKSKDAMHTFLASGILDPVAFKQFQQQITNAQKALDNFGKSEDKLKIKTETTWKGMVQDLKQGANALHELQGMGEEAFDGLARNIGTAFQSIVLGQQSVGKALEEATAQQLASIASQAAVKALFYTGEGFAALAGFNAGSATQYFTAAAEMIAVAAAAGVAGHALSGVGGGGSSSSNEQQHNSVSNTGQSNRSGGSAVGVQAFATGGLISAPTLAIMGEQSKREAVLPLDDPQAMSTIGKAIDKSGAGDIHVHVNGLVSDDKLVNIMGKMSKLVHGGKAQLVSSNSLRLTKRSA